MQIQTPDQMLSRIQKELPFSRTPNAQENPFQRENIERESPFHRQAIDTVPYLRRLRHRYSMSMEQFLLLYLEYTDTKEDMVSFPFEDLQLQQRSVHVVSV